MPAIRYTITPVKPEAHLFEIICTIPQPDKHGQTLAMPAWIPGSYMIRDFSKNIVLISASSHNKPVKISKTDKDQWQCAIVNSELKISYQVYAWDLSVRTAHLDRTHGFFNGTSVFLRVLGQEHLPCEVEIHLPAGKIYQDWKVATALTIINAQKSGFGLYGASNYDELIDHPVEMGTFDLLKFDACGVPHEVTLTGKHDCDTERLCTDLKIICEHHIRFFGEPAPMQKYVFMIMIVTEGRGGLEHRASTALITPRDGLPRKHQKKISSEYRDLLGLCSHEYFHTWNVKRIKPLAFTPYDLQRENYTNLLWAFEGITSYYDDLALMRCGLITTESYLELLGQNITRLLRGKGRQLQTIFESSFDAWTKFYKQDENSPNAIVSYYVKGALIALCLDLMIRKVTENKLSLDNVMRELWKRYGQTDTGVSENDIETLIGKMTQHDCSSFFDDALRSTKELDIQLYLSSIGIQLHLRPAESQNDKGGLPAKNGIEKNAFGARIESDNNLVKLIHVFSDGAAELAGLAAGDTIIAINELRVTAAQFENRLQQFNIGAHITVHAFRRDELMTTTVILQSAPADTAWLQCDSHTVDNILDNRKQWINGSLA